MAILKKNSLPGLTGKLGQLVIREVNGKQVVSAKPDNRKTSQSKKAVSNRKSFHYVNSFAKFIYFIPGLSALWAQCLNRKYIVYNSIVSENKKYVTDIGLTLSNTIVPSSDYNFINDITLNNNSVDISVDLTQKYISTVIENKFNIILIFAGYDKYGTLSYKFDENLFIPEENIDISLISFQLQIDNLDFVKSHTDVIVFGTMIWNLRNNFELCWSSTFGKKI